MGTTLLLILSWFILIKYSDDGSPAKEVAPVLTGLVTRGVKVNKETKSVSKKKLYGPSPNKIAPLPPSLSEGKQMANFLAKLKAEENCEGGDILVLPRPAMP